VLSLPHFSGLIKLELKHVAKKGFPAIPENLGKKFALGKCAYMCDFCGCKIKSTLQWRAWLKI